MTRQVHIVPHTHWDREWYRTFQSFRMELVELVDETIELLESTPAYRHFMLDGQMAVVDDYLEIRPEQRDRLEHLARSGRLLMGPWYILMDEFLVSGETIVRDLQLGLARAESFGGAMPVGYLPDMFGHIAQMPQILRGFGFEDTVVWRGVPRAVTEEAAFTWQAPDGSEVIAQYLPRGYGNGVGLPPGAADLIKRVELFTDQTGARSGTGDDPVLWMHGTDHRHPIPQLVELVAEANDRQLDWHFTISSLPAYVAEQRAARPPAHSWRGELRSGARANLLMGVASNRVDVKIAAARAERTLERLAEPLSALLLPAGDWPGAFLDEAWMLMIQNSAHDSICACSHDDVVEAVRVRYAEANAIGEGLLERALVHASGLGAHLDAEVRAIVVNPASRPRSGVVELTVAAGDELPGTQLVRTSPARLPMATITVGEALGWLDIVEDHLGEVVEIEVTEHDDDVEVALLTDPARFGLLSTDALRRTFTELAERRPDAPARISISSIPTRRLLAYAHDVPGFGWRAWRPGAAEVAPVQAAGTKLSNGTVEVVVADDGTFAINGVAGFGQLVDDGDKGDTYNWCPPAEDRIVDVPDSVETTVLEDGPLRARLRITARYTWPERLDGERRIGEVTTTVDTTVELQAGWDFVRVDTRFDNHARDHRLRAWFPLPEPAATSRAECAFAIVERGLTAEGGVTEVGLPTQPSRRFVSAGGLTVAHEGLVEYELVDIAETAEGPRARALALTLLRATGLLSQAPMATRALPAGPIHRLEGPQMPGPHRVRYALHLGDRDPYAVVDDAFLPMHAVGALTGAEADDAGLVAVESAGPSGGDTTGESLLDVRGAQVSALRRLAEDPGVLELRVFNPTDAAVTVTVAGRRGSLVDLRGTRIGGFDGELELRPWGIQTLHLDA